MKQLLRFKTFLLMAVLSILAGTNAWADDETIEFSAQGYTNAQQVTETSGTVVKATFTNGSTATAYYNTGTGVRLYGGGSVTITANDNTITKIVYTFSAAGYAPSGTVTWDPSDGTATLGATTTWEGSATSVKLSRPTGSGHWRLQKVVVTYEAASTPGDTRTATTIAIDDSNISNTNVFNGTAAGSLSATVSANDAPINASVTWAGDNDAVATIDATTGVVTLVAAGSVTFTASYAGDNSYKPSSKTYTLTVINADPNGPGTENNPYTVAQARAAIDAGTGLTGVYATGIVSQVDGYNSTYNSITYWISADGTTTSDQLEVYSGKGLNNTNFSSVDDVVVGATVVVYGTLKKYGSTYEFDKNNYLTSYTVPVITTPYFSADNVDIAYDATAGDIAYTVENAVAGGTVTASTTSTWLTLGNDFTSPIAFTSTANTAAAARTATVTLTYTYGNNETATKDVTVTQAGNPDVVNNISDITEVGTAYVVKGTVVATNNKGFIIGDGTGYVYTYLNATPTVSVGENVKISGTTGSYGQVIQFTNSATVEAATSSNYNGDPQPEVITTVPDYSSSYHLSTYLQFEGTLTKSNNNYFVAVGESQIRIAYPTTDQATDLAALENKTVRVHGFFSGISGTTNAVFTATMESVEEVTAPATPSITVNIPNPADVNADGGDNEFEVTYTNLAADPQLAVVFCDANGDAVADGTYNWITATYNATSGKIDGHIDVNTGDARTAYFKVSGKAADGSTVYSELITINQSAYNPSITMSEGSINFEATGGSKTLSFDYESLGSNPTFEVKFFESDGVTETGCGWIMYQFDSNDNKVTVTAFNNDEGAARTAYFKVYAEVNKTTIYSNLVTVNQAAPVVDYATLPFAFDGGRADIENTSGLTQENLGSDYGSSPKLKFNNDKQTISSLVLKINERPGTLTFDIKGNSFSGGTFKVQTSEDGTTYTDLETYTALGDKQSESFDNLGENVRYIKWIYTEKSSGNVALGNIALTKYVEPSNNPVINADNVNLAYNATSGEIAYTITNPVDGSNLNATTTAVWISNVTVESDKVTFATSANDGDERTAEVTLSYKGAADKVVTVTQAKYVAPATGDNYELYSGALVEGDYIIYYDGYAMNTTVTSDRLQYEEVTPVNDVITTDNAAIVWHIAPSSDYWTIYNADAKAYAASTGAKNKAQMLDDGTDDKALWTVSGTGTYEFVNKQNTTNSVNATLRLNSGYGFACYSDQTGGALTLYKKSSTPTPGTPSITLNQYVYNVNADGGNNELPVTCTNLAADPQLDVVFVESDGVTVATYGWIKAAINANGNIAGHIDANTGAARTAYLVVTGVDADNNVVKSNLVTINQAAPAAPSIVFDPASIDFDSNDGNRTIGGDYFACNDFASTPSLEILFYKSDGETPATYDWLMVGFNNEGKIDIAYDENTGAARSAYLKLHAEGTSVYSNLFTINQAAAADPNTIIFDFTTNDWGLPLTSENVSERREFKKDGYTIALTAGGNNKYGFNTDGYLLLGKNGATLEFPIFDFLVDKITIEGNTGASTSVKQAIYMKTYSEGLKQASSTTTGATGTNEYNISWGCQAAGEELLLQVTSAHNTQITRILIHKKETVDVTIGSTGYATLYYGDKNFSYGRKGGVSAYAVNLTNGALKMEAISNQAVIPAGTAMVLEGNPGTHVFEVEDAAFSSIAAVAEVNFTGCDNLLRGYDEPALTTGPDAGDYLFYLLGVGTGNKVGFYWGADNGAAFTSGAHKAYLAVPAEKAGDVRAFYFDDTTTGIDALNLNIEGNDAYDLQGRRVQQVQKGGLYIINGKKMLAK